MNCPKTLIEIIADFIRKNESPEIENVLPSPNSPPNSRLNRCYFKIIATGSSTKTRCVQCDIADNEKIDCSHLPFCHDKNPRRTPIPEIFAPLLPNKPNLLTPIIVTDKRCGELPEDIRKIECEGRSLRESIRETFHRLVLQSYNPPPLVVISAGSYDFSAKGKAYNMKRVNFGNEYLKPVEQLEDVLRNMGGDLMIATLIPRMAEQDVREGNLLSSSERRDLRDYFWMANDKIIERNRQYGKNYFLDITKYFTTRPNRKRRIREVEKGYSSRPQCIKEAYQEDGITPSVVKSGKVNFTLISTAVAKSGLKPIDKSDFQKLVKRGKFDTAQ